jgi:hypothetical protein
MLSSSITTRLEYQHKSIFDLTENLSDEQLRAMVVPGKWSIFENIVHLAVYQHTFLRRMEQVLKQETPTFERYTAETDPLFADSCKSSSRDIFKDLIAVRKQIISMIVGLNKQQLHHKGIHPAYGKLSITQWTEFFLLHEAHHLFTIFKLSAAFRA